MASFLSSHFFIGTGHVLVSLYSSNLKVILGR